jgi:methylenetetrahydrofolate reductase (NADPH)
MKHHIDNKIYHIEILAPKQNSEKLDEDMAKFAEKWNTVLDAGYVACITDNPMGNLSFQATELIPELGLRVVPDQVSIHLNTFHTKQNLDDILTTAAGLGITQVLCLTGDGNERMPKLAPEAIGETGNSVTSVELLKYIRKEYPGKFNLGVAFNPYEPQDHEMEKMHRKLDAGAEFITTQPILGRDERVFKMMEAAKVPVIIEAWMSKKLSLLSSCVGYTIPEDTPYDPMTNLAELNKIYPTCGLYLSMVLYKTQFPFIRDIWK